MLTIHTPDTAIWERYIECRAAGEGEAFGQPFDDAAEAAEREQLYIVRRLRVAGSDSPDVVLARSIHGELFVIEKQTDGPWGVRVQDRPTH